MQAQVTAGPISDLSNCVDAGSTYDSDFAFLDASALNGQDPSAHTVSYYLSAVDAQAGTNPIQGATSLQAGTYTIHVRVEENATGQFALTTFIQEVGVSPNTTNNPILTVCGAGTATGDVLIDLGPIASDILNDSANYGLLISLYTSYGDAINSSSPVDQSVPFQVNNGLAQMWLRIDNPNYPDCSIIENLDINAAVCSSSFAVNLYDVIDPATGTACFDLTQNDSNMLTGLDPALHTVTYHLSQADASTGVNPINGPYCTNNTQFIFAVATETATGNIVAIESFTVTANNSGCNVQVSLGILSSVGTMDLQFGINGVNVAYFELEYGPTGFTPGTGTFLSNLSQQTTLAGLVPGTTYCFYARAVCTTWTPGPWSPVNCATFSDVALGDAPNIELCTDTSSTVCVDLTTQDAAISQYVDASLYTVTYYENESDALAGNNPIASANNYCPTANTTQVYYRLEETATGTLVGTESFFIISQSYQFVPGNLILEACDDDQDQIVVHDLQQALPQLPAGNTVTYYSSIANAVLENNALASSVISTDLFQQQLIGGIVDYYARETVTGDCDNIYYIDLVGLGNCDNAYSCDDAQLICNALGSPVVNVSDNSTATAGNDYGCLGSNPRNPSWFYIPIDSDGTLVLDIYQNSLPDFTGQNQDIDYVIYGPFTSSTVGCSAGITQSNIVDCGFAAVSPEIAVIPNALAGEFYLLMTSNWSQSPGYMKFEIGTGTTASVSCDGLRLEAFLDANANGALDTGEVPFPLGTFGWDLNMSGMLHQVTAPTGSYTIYEQDPANVYDTSFTVLPQYASNYMVTPASVNGLTVPTGSGTTLVPFAVQTIQDYDDLATYIVPLETPRPGFTYTERVYYSNLGTTAVTGAAVAFTYDPQVSVVTISDPLATDSGTAVNLSVDLQPFQTGFFDVQMQVPVIPTINLGDVVINTSSIAGAPSDIDSSNNAATSAQTVIGSYDPNDKMESRGERVDVTTWVQEDWMYYTVRFQNDGTAPAVNVRIEDTLEPTLQADTFQMLESSHPVVTDRVGNQITWRFNNIQLVDSSVDLAASQGFVYFKVRSAPGMVNGSTIQNDAEIYFDFNPAIITNNFTTTFEIPLGISDLNAASFAMYPNPASGRVVITLGSLQDASMTIVDLRGRITLSRKLEQTTSSIDVSDFAPGVYLVTVQQGNRTSSQRLVVE